MKVSYLFARCALVGLVMTTLNVSAQAVQVQVSITNLSPMKGTLLTPVWVGFHDGGFDLYDMGAASSPQLERIAEDGNTGPLTTLFAAFAGGSAQGTILGSGPPIPPGETASMTFDLNPALASSRYFSYASMVIPSNDAFIANGNPMAHRIFDNAGNLLGADFIVLGSNVLDAGTELNDEVPANTAAFGQMSPDTGVAEGGVVHLHPGFKRPGMGGILDSPNFTAADFIAQGYQVARITVGAPIPEPGAWALALAGMGAVWMARRTRRRA